MEYYFPSPKPSFLTASILYFLTAIVLVVIFFVFGDNISIVIFIFPAILFTLGLSVFNFIMHIEEREQQFKIHYSLEVGGYTQELNRREALALTKTYPIISSDNTYKVYTPYPTKNITLHLYKFTDDSKKDFIAIYNLSARPENQNLRVFVRPPVGP